MQTEITPADLHDRFVSIRANGEIYFSVGLSMLALFSGERYDVSITINEGDLDFDLSGGPWTVIRSKRGILGMRCYGLVSRVFARHGIKPGRYEVEVEGERIRVLV